MNESDLDGTLVLEKLSAIGKVEDFFDAIDSDDLKKAASLMRAANVDPQSIAMVLKEIIEKFHR